MKYSRILLLFILFSYSNLFGQKYDGFSHKEIQSVFKQWNLDIWDDGGEISRYIFLNMPEFWTHATIHSDGHVKSLKEDYSKEIAEFKVKTDAGEMTLEDYVETSNKVDGMIILHGDRIVYEAYPRMFPHDKHLSWSVSKVFVSTLIAILEDRGQVDVTKPIEHYIPELIGSGWENVAIIDILDMASGIDCLEWVDGAYSNPENCFYQYDASFGLLKQTEKTAENPFEHIKALLSAKSPGKIFEYSSVNTFVLSCLIERVTGHSYAQNIESEIWKKIGAESDAYIVQSNGTSYASGGISATLRDLARFGYMFLESGRSSENTIVSNDYFNKIQNGGRPHLITAFSADKYRLDNEVVHHNTYQWDMVMEDGDFFKDGFSGQGIFISPSRNLIIAFFGTADNNGVSNKLADISRQISKSGILH